jgi:hypothetical protein
VEEQGALAEQADVEIDFHPHQRRRGLRRQRRSAQVDPARWDLAVLDCWHRAPNQPSTLSQFHGLPDKAQRVHHVPARREESLPAALSRMRQFA